MIYKHALTFFILFLTFSMPLCAENELKIVITEGVVGAKPLAIVPFQGSSLLPENISKIIYNDLKRSGRFNLQPTNIYPAYPHQGSEIEFQSWRKINTEYLLIGRIKSNGPGGYLIYFELFDAVKGRLMKSYQLLATQRQIRRAAHQAAALIYKSLEGVSGNFLSRILYITTSRFGNKIRNNLYVADADGHHPQVIISSKQPIMSPTWSPDGKKVAYVSFENRLPAIFIHDLRTRKRTKIAAFKGINGAPSWSPNGRLMAMTLSKDGNSEIYVMNLVNRKLTRITRHPAIDTEPSWSPDNKHLIFTSDRGGKPQIYQIPISGGKAKRITWEGIYNARGRLSPDGKKLVMVTRDKGRYRIAVQDMKTGQVAILTDGQLDESPSFSPNGRMIIYASQSRNKGVLSIVSVDGLVKQRLASQFGSVREPIWSPYRHH